MGQLDICAVEAQLQDDLLGGSLEGRSDARFVSLFEEHSRAVLGYALRRAASRDDAADVVAEVFLVVWRRMDSLPKVAAEVRPWVLGVARRVLMNQRRGARRRTRLSELIRQQIPPAALDLEPADDRLVVAFSRLDESDRELLRLSSWEQLRPAEIAVVLGVSDGAVRTRLHRARQRLRTELRAFEQGTSIDHADVGDTAGTDAS